MWLLLALFYVAQAYPHRVPACGSCDTEQTAAEEAAREHRSLAEQAEAAAAAGAGEALALGLGPHYQAQYAGKAAFTVYYKAKKSLKSCSYEAAKLAAETAKNRGLDVHEQLDSGAVTAALSLASVGQSFHQQAAGAFAAAKRLARDLLPEEQQATELEQLRGPISFITGVDPTATATGKGATDLSEPASPILPQVAAMDIAQMDETEKLPARGLPNWAWFFISFVVATGLVGSFAFCYRNMGARESQLLEEEDDWDDLE